MLVFLCLQRERHLGGSCCITAQRWERDLVLLRDESATLPVPGQKKEKYDANTWAMKVVLISAK